jgi:Sec-independent protein translocase protein TatA
MFVISTFCSPSLFVLYYYHVIVVVCFWGVVPSWSECAIDNNDDDGGNRDGDEQWYLQRTQDFCANAAFSLYGVRTNHISALSCSRSNYINSFFTYGGADSLLHALKKQPSVYYNTEYKDEYYNSYIASTGNSTNSDCVVNKNDDLSSTMGCNVKGKFAIAAFEGQYCHGSGFYDIIDPLTSYNRQMSRVGCHKVWGKGLRSSSHSAVTELLSNSWSCDLDLYPHGCPDPYGQKKRYDYALRAVAHGQNPSWAVANMKLKRPLRILSWFLLLVGVFFLIFGYNVKNRHRIASKGGGLRGFFRVWSEDVHEYRKDLARKRREAKLAAREKRLQDRAERKKKRKSSKKKSTRSSRGSNRREAEIELAPSASSDRGGYESPRTASKKSQGSRRCRSRSRSQGEMA